MLGRERSVLGRSVTLIESSRPEDQRLAQELLERLMPYTGRSIRVGITGVPGAGKSSLIEVLGCRLTAAGHRVAVLAVDPSSPISGGSILADRTRMVRLGAEPNAYIRPSPSGPMLGGVARKTRETLLLCEAAGTAPPCPDEMVGSLAAVRLPDGGAAEITWRRPDPLQQRLFDGWGVEVPVISWPAPPQRLVRVSAQLYNERDHYVRLADALRKELADERDGATA